MRPLRTKRPGLGLATWDHLRPFQCRMNVLGSALGARRIPVLVPRRVAASTLDSSPTAQALAGDVEATAVRSWSNPGLGLLTRFQPMPFHGRMRVRSPGPLLKSPTAQALAGHDPH